MHWYIRFIVNTLSSKVHTVHRKSLKWRGGGYLEITFLKSQKVKIEFFKIHPQKVALHSLHYDNPV